MLERSGVWSAEVEWTLPKPATVLQTGSPLSVPNLDACPRMESFQHGVLDFSLDPSDLYRLWPFLPYKAISPMTSCQRVLRH